jgi:hypothetical protein
VYVASIVARACAAGLFAGVLGSAFTWGERSAVFDLANSPHGISKPELGYFIGPALILIALPLVRHRKPHVAYAGRYRARLGIVLLFWSVGLALLLIHLAGLDGEYTLQAGAYVATALISIGLVATLAMWPVGLGTGLFDRRGGVEPTAARSPDAV